jgi:hypothetical protein
LPSPSDIRPGAILTTYSQQVYSLSLASVIANTGLSAAAPAGWRVYAGNAANRTVFGSVLPRPGLTPWRLVSIFYGPRAWDGYQASQALGTLAQVQTDDYALRVVGIPALNLEIFWLASQNPAIEDFVVPYPASPNQPINVLNTAPWYTAATFLAIIRPLAIQRAAAPPGYGS